MKYIIPALTFLPCTIVVPVQHGKDCVKVKPVHDDAYMKAIASLKAEAPKKLGLTQAVFLCTEDDNIMRRLLNLQC